MCYSTLRERNWEFDERWERSILVLTHVRKAFGTESWSWKFSVLLVRGLGCSRTNLDESRLQEATTWRQCTEKIWQLSGDQYA